MKIFKCKLRLLRFAPVSAPGSADPAGVDQREQEQSKARFEAERLTPAHLCLAEALLPRQRRFKAPWLSVPRLNKLADFQVPVVQVSRSRRSRRQTPVDSIAGGYALPAADVAND